ncbi:MAG: sortase [Bacillota bacterium]|nr:sortase [Bacillota bacterium]
MSRLYLMLIVFLILLLTGCQVEEAVIEEIEEVEEVEEFVPDPYLHLKRNQPELYEAYVSSFIHVDEVPEEVIVEEFSVGRIIIPAIDVDYFVQGGVDIYDPVYLNRGPVHMQMTDLPSNMPSNVSIGGHRMGPMHFFDLDQLEEGDLIFLDIKGYRFTYAVLWQEILDKYDWSIIDEKTDYPALSLQTCEPKYAGLDPDYRLFVRAKLVGVGKAIPLE